MGDQQASGTAARSAFVAAYAAMGAVRKDRTNPHFRSKYATMGSIDEVVRPALSEHGLALLHRFVRRDGAAWCEAVAVHSEGGEVAVEVPAPGIDDSNPQKAGSAMTYARRYSTLALFGLATDDDDDGNGSAPNRGRQGPPPSQRQPQRPSGPPGDPVEQIRKYVSSSFDLDSDAAAALVASAFDGSPNLGGGSWRDAAPDALRGLLQHLQTPDGFATLKAAKDGGQ